MKKLFNKSKKGFTIVELVIVIGVIGILSAILIPTFVNLNSKASEAALKSDLAAVYASYVADAADGYQDEDKNKPLEMYGQQDVCLKKNDGENGKYYTYTADKGWSTELTPIATDSRTGYTLSRLGTDLLYSDYQVWAFVENAN